MFKLGRQAIRIKIIGLILLAFVMLFLAFFYFLSGFLNDVEENLGVKLIRQQASITKQRAMRYFTNDKSLIDQSLLNHQFQLWMRDPDNPFFKRQAVGAIESTCNIIGCEGWFLYSHLTLSGFDWNEESQLVSETKLVLERDRWYTDIIATGKPYFIDASIHPFNGNPYVYFDYLIRDQRELLGLVGTYVSIDIAIENILDHPSDGVSNLLLDNNHIVRAIPSSQSSLMHLELVNNVNGTLWTEQAPPELNANLEALRAAGDETNSIIVQELSFQGREYIGAFIFIEELEWFAVSLLDKEVLNSKVDTFPLIVISVLILLTMIFITIYVLNTQVLNSIMHMNNVVTRIAEGHYSEKVELAKDDELGALGDGINKMTKTLSDNLQRIEKQNDALNNAIFEAEEASNAKSQFLSNMSHELRTPMNAVLGYTQIGIDATGESEKNTYLDKIHQSGEHLLHVINDILDFNKIESDSFTLESTSFKLSTSLKKVLDMSDVKASQKGLALTFKIDKNIPKHLIGDPFRVEQILINLLSNAIKFTDEGSVDIHANLVKQGKGKALLELSVTDTGIGIAQDSLQLLFTSFSQADNSITRKYGGTGLGLTITKQLVEHMNGSIQVESELGAGSTFSFTIELGYSNDPIVKRKRAKFYNLNELVKVTRNRKILLVEDNEINRLVVEKMLEELEPNLDFAVNGQEAVQKVESGPYDLVLMDVQMPVLDGIDATRLIRKSNKSIIIIGLSAHANTENSESALNAGMNDYLTKPINKQHLFQTLYDYLQKITEQQH